jgi:hypothetical protein
MCMADPRSGLLGTTCEVPPFAFDFSEITNTCYVNQCIKDKDVEIVTVSYLSAPGGIIDLGISDTNYLRKPITVPDTGYKASLQFVHLHLYAIKTHEGNYALLLEGTTIVGGCLHLRFYWTYNDNGSREFGPPVAIRNQKETFRVAPRGAGDTIKGVVDIRGRLAIWHSKTCGIKLYVDKAGKVLRKVNAIP